MMSEMEKKVLCTAARVRVLTAELVDNPELFGKFASTIRGILKITEFEVRLKAGTEVEQ